MDYTSLVASKSTPGSIASWANYGLAPASDVLDDAQKLIYTLLRVREMMSDPTPLAWAQGASAIALPADFLDPIDVRDALGCKVRHKDWDGVANRRVIQTDGSVASNIAPSVYAILGTKMQLDCSAAAASTVQLVYFQRPAPLAAGNPTNFLTDRYPFLLRAACLAAAADFRKHDSDYQRNVSKLTMMVQEINRENDLYLRSVEIDPDWSPL